VAICLATVVMQRFNWFQLSVQRQVVKVQVPAEDDVDYGQQIADVLIRHTTEFELGEHGVHPRRRAHRAAVRRPSSSAAPTPRRSWRNCAPATPDNGVAILTGYDQTDL
jgi:hypothetical protein